MKYKVMAEPTDEEFITFFNVERYFEELLVAQIVGEMDEQLTDEEFDEIVCLFHKADFGQEEADYILYEYDRIIRERR